MKKYTRKLTPEFAWAGNYYAQTQSKHNKFYRSSNPYFDDAEEITPEEYFEAADEYSDMFRR